QTPGQDQLERVVRGAAGETRGVREPLLSGAGERREQAPAGSLRVLLARLAEVAGDTRRRAPGGEIEPARERRLAPQVVRLQLAVRGLRRQPAQRLESAARER